MILLLGKAVSSFIVDYDDSELVDCPTQLICTLDFHLGSMTKLKEHSREIC